MLIIKNNLQVQSLSAPLVSRFLERKDFRPKSKNRGTEGQKRVNPYNDHNIAHHRNILKYDYKYKCNAVFGHLFSPSCSYRTTLLIG